MNKIEGIPLNKLLLDKKNPRIHQTISENITQLELTKFIFDEFGISDLKDSILKNGYFPVEPLVVIPSDDDNYIVVEGNRRLTTLKILCNTEFREHCISEMSRGDYIATQELIKQSLTLPVVIADDRESVNAYLGVRHLNGVRMWKPLAQAKYVYDQIIKQKNSTEEKTIQSSIEKFIKETNNKKTDVLNLFYKYCIYLHIVNLIEDSSLKEAIGEIEKKFSLLEVALEKAGKSSIAQYIGINGYNKLDAEDYENIIEEENNDKVKNIIEWVFMPNSPIKESREISSHLKKILKSEVATQAFERGESKEEALLLANPSDEVIRNLCKEISRKLTTIQNHWDDTKLEDRQELQEFYKTSVVKKVEKTKNAIDL